MHENITPRIQIAQSKNLIYTTWTYDFSLEFTHNRAYCLCRSIYLIYHGNTRASQTKLKITKMARCAEELDVVDESDEKIKRIFRF